MSASIAAQVMGENNNFDLTIVDSVYDNDYFRIAKQLQVAVGLWPYQTGTGRKIRQVAVIANLILILIPLVHSANKYCGVNYDICSEMLCCVVFIILVIWKYTITWLVENKLKDVYKTIAFNWSNFSDPEDKAIMTKLASVGKIRGVYYVVFVFLSGFSFTLFPLGPIVLDFILPLNETREKLLVVRADYLLDPEEHYFTIYGICVVTTATICMVVTSIDFSYVLVMHQILGMFSVITHRIKVATVRYDPRTNTDLHQISAVVKLHQYALRFISMIEQSYSLLFLATIGGIISYFFLITFVILYFIDRRRILDLVRTLALCVGVLSHLIYLSWPGQMILDSNHDLFIAAYANEWYNISKRGQLLLQFVMRRCVTPSVLTAGGLYIMNFENLFAIIKTTVSYIAVAISMRE